MCPSSFDGGDEKSAVCFQVGVDGEGVSHACEDGVSHAHGDGVSHAREEALNVRSGVEYDGRSGASCVRRSGVTVHRNSVYHNGRSGTRWERSKKKVLERMTTGSERGKK